MPVCVDRVAPRSTDYSPNSVEVFHGRFHKAGASIARGVGSIVPRARTVKEVRHVLSRV